MHRKREGALDMAQLQSDRNKLAQTLEDIWRKEDELDEHNLNLMRAATYIILAVFEDLPMSILNVMYIRGLFLSSAPRPSGPALITIFL
jgi:hypothetical protein